MSFEFLVLSFERPTTCPYDNFEFSILNIEFRIPNSGIQGPAIV